MKKSILFLVAGLLYTASGCSRNVEHLHERIHPFYKNQDDTEIQPEETDFLPHELSLWGASGISTLNCKPVFGKAGVGTDGAFGVDYSYFFNRHWGLLSGMEYAFYQGSILLNGVSGASETPDLFGNRTVSGFRMDNCLERQRIGMLNIPLSLLYQSGNRHKFYTSFGAKLGLPLSGKYGIDDAAFTAWGYYSDYNQTEIWQNDLGYGVFPVKSHRGDLDLGISFMGTLEGGIKWNTGHSHSLYTGIYMDYGFNDIIKNPSPGQQIIEYNMKNPSSPLIHSVLTSNYGSKVSPFALGLKVKWSFSLGNRDLPDIQNPDDDDFYEFIRFITQVYTIKS